MPYPGVQNLVGYPISVGGKRLALAPNGHAGPTSYTVVTNPTTGGDFLQASELGLKWIDAVLVAGVSSNGLHRVIPVNPTRGPVSAVQLKWLVDSTGAEVAGAVNLSVSVVNIVAIGE
jgi:hypothetical protein